MPAKRRLMICLKSLNWMQYVLIEQVRGESPHRKQASIAARTSLTHVFLRVVDFEKIRTSGSGRQFANTTKVKYIFTSHWFDDGMPVR